jgi:hypothetical protein
LSIASRAGSVVVGILAENVEGRFSPILFILTKLIFHADTR